MRRLLPLLVFGGLLVFHAMPAHAADGDGDLIDDAVDVCPTVADPFQGDLDGDGVGDLCEPGTVGVNSFDGTSGNDLVFGTDEADTLAGAAGNDALYGGEGDDTLRGGSGQDFLVGGPGTDTLTGGSGCDMFAVNPSGDSDIITDFNPLLDRLLFPGHADDTTDDVVPVLTFAGDDDLVVTFETEGSSTSTSTSTSTLQFDGLEPGVEVTFLTSLCTTPPKEEPEVIVPEEPTPPFVCSPLFDDPDLREGPFDMDFPFDGKVVNGTEADETLHGTHCSDIIYGDGGAEAFADETPPSEDVLTCLTAVCSNDVIKAGDGNDLILGDTLIITGTRVGGDDTIYAGGGDDLVMGDAAYIVDCGCGGGVEEGVAVGGNDTIFGDGGDDALIGDAFDAIAGPNSRGGDDTIDGGDGDDLIIGDAQSIEDGATGGNDTLIGGAGHDIIYGDGFEVDADSFAGNDNITGGAGNDALYGDAVVLNGVAGSDTFVFDTSSNFGADTIFDAGVGGVVDTVSFSGPGLTSIADLDARSDVAEASGVIVIALVYTDASKTTIVGNVGFYGIATGSINSWADIDALDFVQVVIV